MWKAEEDRLDAEHRSLQEHSTTGLCEAHYPLFPDSREEKQLETSRKAQILHGALEKDEDGLGQLTDFL